MQGTQTACEGVNEDTCGHDVKQKADKAKRDRESLWRQLQQARFTYRYKGSSSCKMFIRYAEWGHALLKSIEDAVEKFVKAAACLISRNTLSKGRGSHRLEAASIFSSYKSHAEHTYVP